MHRYLGSAIEPAFCCARKLRTRNTESEWDEKKRGGLARFDVRATNGRETVSGALEARRKRTEGCQEKLDHWPRHSFER
jgi:hypothetical protein